MSTLITEVEPVWETLRINFFLARFNSREGFTDFCRHESLTFYIPPHQKHIQDVGNKQFHEAGCLVPSSRNERTINNGVRFQVLTAVRKCLRGTALMMEATRHL
jgi:hypothetical protein